MRQMKPKVVIFYDRDGWAFHNIATECLKHLSDEFEIEIRSAWPRTPKSVRADIAVLMWYGYHHLFTEVPPGCKKITCFYDESLWTSQRSHFKNASESVSKSDLVLGASPHIEGLLKKRFPVSKILPCYDGVCPAKFPAYPYRSGVLEGKTRLRVGWTGNSDPSAHGDNKGVHLIKEAASQLTDVDFDINDRFRKNVWTPHDKMHEWYRDLDLVLCMSRQEGTPNPILEASSSGRAWVSTDVGIVRPLMNSCQIPHRPGLLISRKTLSLVHAIRYLDQNRSELVKMGSYGRRAVEKEWTWCHRVEQFRTAIRSLL